MEFEDEGKDCAGGVVEQVGQQNLQSVLDQSKSVLQWRVKFLSKSHQMFEARRTVWRYRG